MEEHGRNFDDLVERLSQRVHAGPKGQLRLRGCIRQIRASVVELEERPLRVLDVGAGLGQIAVLLAADGHEVTAMDLSANMVDAIRAHASENRVSVRCIHGSLQTTARSFADKGEQFDLVCCHAALEWMTDPEAAVACLKALVRPQGWLSLLCYNNAALVHRNLLRGNFRRAQATEQVGTEGGLTPSHPLELQQLEKWLSNAGFDLHDRYGVRSILDFLPRELVAARGADSIDDIEQWLEQREPHWRLARYLHLIARG